MTEQKKPLKIEFAPGCFDAFEGTQEELDGLMAEIHRMFESGEIFEKATTLDLDDLSPEEQERILSRLESIDFDEEDNITTSTVRKNLH
jgi:hypothetical protein